MNFLHYEFDAGPNETVEVNLDHAANVLLLDMANYSHYQSGLPYQYHGGYAEVSPFRLRPPSHKHWHLVVDLGGGAGSVRASVQIVPRVGQLV